MEGEVPSMIKAESPEMDSLPMPPAMEAPMMPSSPSIPLLCCVCPDTPRFSDVSHLLTHIASKGHLHHETQTKLKAHQDINASAALQNYDFWYREHGIEQLLVERMKAKQAKESARNKRLRSSSSGPHSKNKKRPRRTPSDGSVKPEDDDFMSPIPWFPGFIAPDSDAATMDDPFAAGDMMSLKGQVWPGMGKMDLANEEMKRTRNQRKPKSAVDRMRRTSEGISPTQVVMTSEFDVERVKGVYDDDSPVSDEEDQPPPPKPTRTRRKKQEPLAKIPANVPRGSKNNNANQVSSFSKPMLPSSHTINPDESLTMGSFVSNQDMFRENPIKGDDLHWPGVPSLTSHETFEAGGFSMNNDRDQRFDLRDRYVSHPLNPILQANMASPTPSSRDLPSRALPIQETGRARFNDAPYFGHGHHSPLGPYSPHGGPYQMNGDSIYHHPAQSLLHSPCNIHGSEQDQYGANTGGHITLKQDEHGHGTNGDTLGIPNASTFTNHTGNPLNQARVYLSPYQTTLNHHGMSSFGLSPANRSREASQSAAQQADLQQDQSDIVKTEERLREALGHSQSLNEKTFGVDPKPIWVGQGSENDLPFL